MRLIVLENTYRHFNSYMFRLSSDHDFKYRDQTCNKNLLEARSPCRTWSVYFLAFFKYQPEDGP